MLNFLITHVDLTSKPIEQTADDVLQVADDKVTLHWAWCDKVHAECVLKAVLTERGCGSLRQ